MRYAVPALMVLFAIACGCSRDEIILPNRDFPVIAKAESGDTTVYLSEVKRVGKRVYLTFRYREKEKELRRASINCSEITGGFDTSFVEVKKDGWVELRCTTDYPNKADKLEFVLAMCRERECEKADVTLAAEVPEEGVISKPGVSGRTGDVGFFIERVASLKGTSSPVVDGKSSPSDYVIPYGEKRLTIARGDENILVVICRADFSDSIPFVPRGFSEWDQVIVTAGRDGRLGGAKSTGDSDGSRYFVLVSVVDDRVPSDIKASFFSASALASLRREFSFSGLPNPHE